LLDRWQVLSEPGHGTSVRFVVLPPDRPERLDLMKEARAQIVINPDAADGMASSIKAGLAAVPDFCSAALFLPADMPEVTQSDLMAMRTAHSFNPRAIIRAATPQGRPGNPVLFPRRFFDEMMQITGDEGGRQILKRHVHEIELVTLPGDHATLDLDTPEDWATWRNSQNQ